MEIKIKALKFDPDQRLTAFIEKKVSRLARFFDSENNIAEVTLKNDIDGKMARIQIHIPCEDLLIERDAKTFEDAITAGVDAMKEKITRSKEKKQE